MKILFASHSSALAGAEQSLVHLVRTAAERGHTGAVALPEPGPLAGRLESTSDSFETVILPSHLWMGRRYSFVVGSVRLLQALSDVPRYLSHIRTAGYDVVVVNSSVSPVPLVSARLAQVPVLQVVRESLISNPMLRSALPKSIIRQLLSRLSTSVICISQFVAGQFSYPSKVFYPQVGSEFLATAELTERPTQTPPQAVICGTISPEKGQLDAVRAIQVARSLGTEVRLDIYGRGELRDVAELESVINELDLEGLVRIMGSTSDMKAAYDSADIAIVCSRNEGFGKVTAEAILMGRPVVAYGLGGTSEILDYGGGLATAASPDALGAALHKVFTERSLLQELGAEARTSGIRSELAESAQRVLDCIEKLKVTQSPKG
ncbi:glycosyltransferase [Arthrobacter sp. OY3WO11]|uniref:glycosyltransferase n=1 Tax=Arthrobacter sp. OY3WO11 TaxID=1835723 RepID=UPI000AF17D0F|nr:glycosyltransferase [Arthrobacter sp. OY3WO11]